MPLIGILALALFGIGVLAHPLLFFGLLLSGIGVLSISNLTPMHNRPAIFRSAGGGLGFLFFILLQAGILLGGALLLIRLFNDLTFFRAIITLMIVSASSMFLCAFSKDITETAITPIVAVVGITIINWIAWLK